MTAIVMRLADDFREFGSEFVANPKTSMYRIYRDIRFSENKAPYKTHVAANFPTRGLPKHEGAGLYFHVSPDEVWAELKRREGVSGIAEKAARARILPVAMGLQTTKIP